MSQTRSLVSRLPLLLLLLGLVCSAMSSTLQATMAEHCNDCGCSNLWTDEDYHYVWCFGSGDSCQLHPGTTCSNYATPANR
jgi:hypothetical protein